MKALIQIKITGLALFYIGIAHAAQIDVTFDNVPPDVQCGQIWTNNGVLLSFSETTGTEGVGAGYCEFQAGSGWVELYPSRFIVDFSLLNQPVSSIQANVYSGIAGLFAYSGTNRISQDENAASGTLSLNFTNLYPDYCAISGGEGGITGITIFTGIIYPPAISIEGTNGVVTVSWATNQNSFVLDTSSDLTNPSGWIAQTNNILFDGTNFFYNIATPVGNEYFRLRH